MIKLNIKDDSNNFLDSFRDIFRKTNQLWYFGKSYGSLIMTSELNINPDPAIARERLFQDYLHECQVLLSEVPNLAERLAIHLIQNDEHWYPGRINEDFAKLYDKRFENHLTLAKNCVLKKSLTYFPMTTRVFMKSNHSVNMRNGVCVKGYVICIGNSIDPSNFKEIGTLDYWISNSLIIWNSLTVMLGLKIENGYKPTKLSLVRIYKNSILVKFHRKFEIEISNANITGKTFFQLQFMKKFASLENSTLNKIDNVVIELPAPEKCF
jgi:hypothetical protein